MNTNLLLFIRVMLILVSVFFLLRIAKVKSNKQTNKKMDKIDEQMFETINGLEIRFKSFSSANTVEIRIENQTYTSHRKHTLRYILIIILCCIFFNIFIRSHAILVALNVAFLVTMATKCYILVNLIEYGMENL